MGNVTDALIVTVIGMGIIFLVLTILLLTIVLLNKAFPHVPEPVAETSGGDDTLLVAVIQAAIAKYLKRRPSDISIKSVK
ncbi:hypothetical protein MNBD_NITROSPINAE02-328 [hydrothermal vent metagenome]|uniref:Oxaloacetate decarboxylase gamma chain n=1 Tax=hydrothermal vent metagenome TaxID=652676 RepID=A0A3B1BXQ5_9ZZZZ